MGESRNYDFDFSSYLAPAETISSSTQVVNLYSGLPGLLPTLVANGGTGNVRTILISAGLVGNVYDVVVTATTSRGQILSLNAFLPILPGQP